MSDLTEADFDMMARRPGPDWLTETAWQATIALARQGLAAQWRPIETAPKDGTEILVTYDPSVGWINTALWCGNGYSSVKVCWRDSFTLKRLCNTPTHWMPLPPPPQARGEGYSYQEEYSAPGVAPSHDAGTKERECYEPSAMNNWCVTHNAHWGLTDKACEKVAPSPSPGVAEAYPYQKEYSAPGVVSEGEPTPRTKCEPSGDDQGSNGLQPQPSVGELIEQLADENANWCTPIPQCYLDAITTLKQQEEQEKYLRRSIKELDEKCDRRAETALRWAKEATAVKRQLREAHAEIEAWKAKCEAAWQQGDRDAHQALVKRYREALEKIGRMKTVPDDKANRMTLVCAHEIARAALTQGE